MMIKKFTLLIFSLFLTYTFLTANKADATDFMTGLYYTPLWWNPAVADGHSTDIHQSNNIGIILGMSFLEKWSLGVLLFAPILEDKDSTHTYNGTGSQGDFELKGTSPTGRLDLDLSIGYKPTKELKIFAGLKLGQMGTASQDTEFTIDNNNYTYDEKERLFSAMYFGPAIGISYSFKLGNGFSSTISDSLLYIRTNFEGQTYYGSDELNDNGTGYLIKSKGYNYSGFGNNVTLAFSYYIKPLSCSLGVGGRYQVIKYFSREDAPDLSLDHFFGPYLYLIYFF